VGQQQARPRSKSGQIAEVQEMQFDPF